MKKLYSILLFLLCIQFSFGQWNTDRIMNIGQNALYFEDYVLSIQYFNQVIKIKPYLPEPYMYRGIAKISLGDFVGAEQDCSEAINRNPFIPQAYFARGYSRKYQNKYGDAIADFNKALEFSPNNDAIIANRMEVKEKNKDYTGAIEDLNLYRKLKPKAPGIDYEIGVIKLNQKDTIAAIDAFDKFILSDTTNANGYSARALLKMQRKDDKGAYEDYTKAIKNKSVFVGDYINRGILNVQRNKFNLALTDYNEAIRLDPKNILAYYNRGLLRANLGDNNNAIGDLSKVVDADSTNHEARLQKAYLELKVGDLISATKDFEIILKKYPFFVPAYYGIAEAKQKGRNKRESQYYKQLAFEIESNKDYYKRKQNLVAKNQMAKETPKNEIKSTSNVFDRFLADNKGDNQVENKYGKGLRGNIQDKYTDVTNERNFVLTYYSKTDEIRRTNTYHPTISKLNGEKKLSSPLKITNDELALTAELINTHFDAINVLSQRLAANPDDADIYFARAMEFALVQDYSSAIDDLNKAIQLRSDFALAYFNRANLRYRQIEYQNNTQTENTPDYKSTTKLSTSEKYKYDFEMIMRDYDKTIALAPDFSFAYYNKGNVLCSLKDYKSGISYYTKAIEIDPDFAEAYFNRGLTFLLMNDESKGNLDISKAGELGIYKSYNIIKRLQK